MTELAKDSLKISRKENQDKGIKIISLLKIPEKVNKQKKNINKSLLGTKRTLFKRIPKKSKNKLNILSINQQEHFSINKTPNTKNKNENDSCIICFEKISFQDKHYLHCGHYFHCECINKWLDFEKNNCPICKRDIDCDKIFDNTISLEEDDDEEENESNNDNNNNEININHRVINNRDIEVVLNRRRIVIENRRQIKFMLGLYICVMIFYILTYLIKNGFLFLFDKFF